jgi:hypothetical protein
VTLIVQVPFASSVLPQVFAETEKSAALAPAIPILEMFKVALPILVRVTDRGTLLVVTDWLPKVKPLVERFATAAVPAPVPVRLIFCGLPLALSVMATEADRLPDEPGVNITAIVQLFPAATEAPQVVVSAKSPGLTPVTAIPEMFNEAFPVFVRVTDCAALVVARFWALKARLVAVRLAVGLAPVPVRLTICGLPMALSVTVISAVRLPADVGVNVTLIVQLPPAASELPQVEVSGKSPELGPVAATLVMLKAALPLFVRMTDCEGVEVPSN